MEKLRLFLAVSVFALLVAACGTESSTPTNQTPTQPVTVSLSDLSATAAGVFVAESRVRFMPVMASMFAAPLGQQIPVSIFVTGKAGVRPLSKEEKESRLRELTPEVEQREEVLTSVTDDLRQQYGKRMKKWPKDAKARYQEAILAFNVANVAAWEVEWFGKNTQKDIDDSVVDLKKALRTVKAVRLVESRTAAELVVEVRGRGRQPVANVFAWNDRTYCNFLGLTVSIGPSLHLSVERADTLKWFHDSFSTASVRRRSTNPPRWDLEATYVHTTYYGLRPVTAWAMAHRAAATGTASVIKDFGKENYDALNAGRENLASAS